MQIKIANLTELKKASQTFLKLLKTHNVFAFYGDMGAGKTTFINAILLELGIKDHTSSPTFSISFLHFLCQKLETLILDDVLSY